MSEPYYPGEWDNEPDDDLGYDPDIPDYEENEDAYFDVEEYDEQHRRESGDDPVETDDPYDMRG